MYNIVIYRLASSLSFLFHPSVLSCTRGRRTVGLSIILFRRLEGHRLVFLVEIVLTAPSALRVVGWSGISSSHGGLAAFVHCSASINRSSSVITAAATVLRVAIASLNDLFGLKQSHQLFVNRDLFALRTEFYNRLVVVSKSDTASVSLVLSTDDHDILAYQLITSQFVLSCLGLSSISLHEFISTDGDVVTVFYKDAVCMHELLVPEEKIVLERVSDGGNQSFILTLLALNHGIVDQGISLHVTTPKGSSSLGWWELLSEINHFN